MQTTHHSNTRCPVYLHPAASTNPAAVETIQKRTGLLVIINIGRLAATLRARPFATGESGPWGGDAA
ncbi:hypothetical protein PspS04_11930 [Pseudomonas sp. S04]|uniref:hypothetical protein n=1 Tax=unclassified Pseudomonas TaxID=196821 RepID=UPI00131F5473|nr:MULTISPECIES: hypothetical protein [unclassified Pseudomonas]QHD01017.1 hypothetical protein PspS04_11930 [Pseudomonas sp. S04]QHF33501.1 hypothetical protein PspS19_11935 [Pseudomonas sp. S19]